VERVRTDPDCELHNEPSRVTKCGEFLGQMSDSYFLMLHGVCH
jgi:hypothetical protein